MARSRAHKHGANDSAQPLLPVGLDVEETAYIDTERVILEQSVWPQFSPFVFVREFAKQGLFPLSLPYYAVRRQEARNQLYCMGGFPFLLHYISVPAAWVMLVLFLWHRSQLAHDGVSTNEVMFVFLVVISHKASVAAKYALLGEDEYHSFLVAPEDKARVWLRNMHIATGWVRPTVPTMVHEVSVAARQLNVDLHGAYLALDSENAGSYTAMLKYIGVADTEEFRRFAAPEFQGVQVINGKECVSALQFMVAVLVHCQHTTLQQCMGPGLTLLTILRCNFLGLLRLTKDFRFGFFGDSELSMVVVLLTIIALAPHFRIMTGFLWTSVASTERRWRMVSEVGALVRRTATERPNHPQLDLSDPNNVHTWIVMRQIAQRVGHRFELRLAVYSLLGQLGTLALVVYIVCLVVMAESFGELRGSADFAQAIVDFSLFVLPVFAMVSFGTLANRRTPKDIESIVSHLTTLSWTSASGRQRSRPTGPSARSEGNEAGHDGGEAGGHEEGKDGDGVGHSGRSVSDEETHDLLLAAVNTLRAMDESSPVQVFGIRAQASLLISMATFVGTALSLVSQLVFHSGE